MGNKVRIKCFELSDDIFDKLLYDFQADVKIVDSTDPYIYGYEDKNTIYYDGGSYLICKEHYINYYTGLIENCTEWKQCRVRRVENMSTKLIRSMDGQTAWEFMIKILEHYYTWEEIKSILSSYNTPYDKGLAQYKDRFTVDAYNKSTIIFKFSNCYKYDINGAHTDALIEMFPKAKTSILKLYNERHINPLNKDRVNYFVGMFVKKGYKGAYNWIVQRTTKTLNKAMDFTGGLLIYANTDGYIISNPINKLETSKELGDFKLEYTGNVYYYEDKNYYLVQCGNEQKGSCLKSVRKYIDLSKCEVVHYNKKKIYITETEYINVADNVIRESLNEESIKNMV